MKSALKRSQVDTNYEDKKSYSPVEKKKGTGNISQ